MEVPSEKPLRRVWGASAVLLPYNETGEVQWEEFLSHLGRTQQAGLVPAVNMDTGYVHLLDEATEDRVLALTSDWLGSHSPAATSTQAKTDRFIAGAVVRDQPSSPFDFNSYARRMEAIQRHGGTPIVFPSFGFNSGTDSEILERWRRLSAETDRLYAFELGPMFAACGRIYSLELFAELLGIKSCVGAKHSSLDRLQEWQRLVVRDQRRPDFRLLTGNDLAIDMIKYGSDYLLGLSTMAPDLFALRDRYWEQGDSRFYPLNDWLQYLGYLTFRAPVPAYRHSAAQWLRLRGWIKSDSPHPDCPRRPPSDVEILRTLWLEIASICEIDADSR